MAYNKNLSINQNNAVNISGSKITLTGSLYGSQISGTTAQFTTVSASVVSASTYYGLPQVAQQLILVCKNMSGASIAKGKVVHITSSQNNSDTPQIILASWDSDLSSANTLGVTMETIANTATGSVILTGMLTQVPLTGTYTEGQLIYLSSSGDITPIKPLAPLHEVRIGQVTRTINSGNNTIFVRVQNGYEIDELHDVLITSKQDGDLLVYNSSSTVWNNSKTLNGNYSITSASISQLTATNLNATTLTASNAFISGDIRINGTASIALLSTISQSSLMVGDKFITIMSGGIDHAGLDGAGILWGSGSTAPTIDDQGANAHILYKNLYDKLEIFPGLYVSGSITASNSLSASTIVGNGSGLVSVPNTSLVNNSINLNGNIIALGGTGSVGIIREITSSNSNITVGTGATSATASIALNTVLTGLTNITASTISASVFTGSIGRFTTVSGTAAEFSGNVLIYGTASLSVNPTSAYVLYSSSLDKVVIFPGLYVSGSLTASNAITASTIIVGTLSASSAQLTGTLNGNATTSTTASAVANLITFNSSGTGASSGASFNGSSAITVSYNTIGAVDLVGIQTISGIKTFTGNNTFTSSQQTFNTTITGSGTLRLPVISGTLVISGSSITGSTSGSLGQFTTLSASVLSASSYLGLAAGAANQIQFNAGSNALGADSTFVWDNANKRLGVGTASPQLKAEIVKGTQLTSRSATNTVLLVSDNSTNQIYLEIANLSQSGLLFSRGSGTGNYGLINYSGSSMQFYTNELQRMIIDSAGNIGIGAAAPTDLLSVGASSQFTVNSSGNITKVNNLATVFPSSTGSAGSVLRNDGAGNLSWSTAGNALFNVTTTATTLSLVATTHDVVLVSAGVTITLPTAVGITGKVFNIKRIGASAVTVATSLSQTIDGSTTYVLNTANQNLTVVSNGSNWFIL